MDCQRSAQGAFARKLEDLVCLLLIFIFLSSLFSYTEEHEVYYFNIHTGESIWDHPMDAYYKALYRQEKVKLEKKRRKMVCKHCIRPSQMFLPVSTIFYFRVW